MSGMVKAEVENGNLIACGAVNLWIALIFLTLLTVALVLATKGADASVEGRQIAIVYGIALAFTVFVATPAGWMLSAYLAQGSCS